MRIVESLAINCRFSSQNLLCPSAIVGDRYERIMIFTVIRFQISFVIMPDDRHAFLPSLEFAGNSVGSKSSVGNKSRVGDTRTFVTHRCNCLALEFPHSRVL